MKVSVMAGNKAHQRAHSAPMVAGLRRHGVNVEAFEDGATPTGDVVVAWGWRNCERYRASHDVVVMERGHLQDRMKFTSLGWNGLCNRGKYPTPDDGGARWRKHFAHHMRAWHPGGGWALLCGQCEGDAALYGMDFRAWARGMASLLRERGERVVYRPHPQMAKFGSVWHPHGAELSERSLEDDLSGAALVVTYNSTTATEAVLSGIATVTRDIGAMAWPVTSHSLDDPLVRPDRAPWAHRMAWCQWLIEEIESGEAWDAVKDARPT